MSSIVSEITKRSIYLDHNATTPIDASVIEKIPDWLRLWGNPSSIHDHGRGPKNLLRESRRKIADFIKAGHPLEIIFTSGGSESNNLVIRGVFDYYKKHQPQKKIFLRSAVEHPSVVKAMDALVLQGAQVKVIPVNRNGEIDLDYYEAHLTPDVALVSVMAASNETGILFPLKKMCKLAHEKGILFHTDAVQAMGKIPFGVTHWGVDFASFAGHKFYALKGSGILYCRRGVSFEPQINGGGQERGRRCGTENLLAIASLAQMTEQAHLVETKRVDCESLRNYMEQKILAEIPNIQVIGKDIKRLPNTSCMIVAGVSGETLLMNLDLKGFSVSTGSACSSGNPEPSAALLSMGITRDEAQSSLRVSLGWHTTASDIDSFVVSLKDIVNRLRKISQTRQIESEL